MVEERPSDGGKDVLVVRLAADLAYHSNLYYNEASPVISDAEFDELRDKLSRLAP